MVKIVGYLTFFLFHVLFYHMSILSFFFPLYSSNINISETLTSFEDNHSEGKKDCPQMTTPIVIEKNKLGKTTK